MTRPLALALLVALSIPRAAGAQTGDADAAAASFAAGEAAVAENDYVAALEHFEAAFRARPHDAVRFNMAVCLEALGRFRDAWLQYRAAMASEQLDDAERADARASAERLRGRLAVLDVTSSAGAEIRVDGDPRCAAPCETEADPGEHEVSAHAADGRTASRDVTVARGETVELALDLPAPPSAAQRPSGMGWLSIVGGSLAAIGIGAAIGLGVHTQALADRYATYERSAPQWLYDDGVLMQALTNGSLVVAGVGVALVVIDAVLAALGGGTSLAVLEPGTGAIRF
jgi:tetratricopeptide (TPR) repeat protein